jgi:hypothetical protein
MIHHQNNGGNMAWFHDYSRDYDRATGYNRGRNPRDTPGMRSSNYGYDSGWGSRSGWNSAFRGYDRGYNRGGYWGESSTRPGYGRDYLGRQYGYDSDYDYQYRRRSPEESPLYGRNADQAVQRWARRYGYDMQYEINPRQGGGSGSTQRGYSGGRQQGGYGSTQAGYGGGRQQGGYGGTSGGYGNRGSRF